MERIPETEAQLQLPDGRTLSYALLGAVERAPAVVVLDGPGSRGLARASAEAASEAGLRLVAPDRPGFMGSTARAGRTFADVAQDVLALADELDLTDFGVLAQSGGTPYALALAAAAPDRVAHLAFVGAISPLGEPDALESVGGPMRGLFQLARRAPWLLRPLLGIAARSVRRNPAKAARNFVKDAPALDQEILAQPRYWDLHERSGAEAMRSPSQFAREAALLAQPWDIDLDAIAAPVAFWVGEHDLTHPPVMSRRMAERLGDAPVTVVPGAATFGMVPTLPEVLAFASGMRMARA